MSPRPPFGYPLRRPPSPEDQDITRRLKETGDMLGIRVLDHVVLGDAERFFSFSDKGPFVAGLPLAPSEMRA